MKQLIVVINKAISLGQVMNSVGHMMVGLGHQIPSDAMPEIKIFTTENTKPFRTLMLNEHQRLGPEMSLYSDFAHTTTEGSARDHEKNTRTIPEADINYYAVCISADEDNLHHVNDQLIALNAEQLKQISISNQTNAFDFNPPMPTFSNDDFVEDDKAFRFTLALDRNLTTAESLTHVIYGYLQLSQNMSRDALRLHQYVDADGTPHPGMSEYGLVVLKGRKANSLSKLAPHAEFENTVDKKNIVNKDGLYSVIAWFGSTAQVREMTKEFNVWSGQLKPEDFENPKSINPSITAHGTFPSASITPTDPIAMQNHAEGTANSSTSFIC